MQGKNHIVEQQATGKVILLVDDDFTIRELGKEMFALRGYQVLTAEDGVEALRIYQEYRADIGLVILDMIMPHMNGRETFYALRRVDPKVKIILSSGYSNEQDVQDLLQQGVEAFIPKPYNVQQFLYIVEEILRR